MAAAPVTIATEAVAMRCASGFYQVPDGAGIGVEPSDAFWKYAEKK